MRNRPVPHAWRVTAGASSLYGIAQCGGFDGPIVTFLLEAVRSPRVDDRYDGKRDKLQLWRWNRQAGVRAIPHHRRRTADSSEPRTRAGRSVHGGYVPRRERLNGGYAGDPDGSAGDLAALGPAAMVAALSRQAYRAVQSARPFQTQCRPALRPGRTAVFPVSRCRQAVQL